jgi:uncharacterized RDD family membrane protein YckC
VRIGNAALRPARAAARSGRNVLTEEAERAIDAVLAGPQPEAVARSIVRHRVVERLVSTVLTAGTDGGAPAFDGEALMQNVERVLRSPELERAVTDALRSPLTETLVDRVVESPAFRRALFEVVSSPEIRHAMSRQATGFGAELAATAQRRSRRGDSAIESGVRRLFRRSPARVATAGYGGLVTRGIGLVLDALCVHLTFLVLAASAALIASIVGNLHSDVVAGSAFGGGWLLVVAIYFIGFWSAAGQTPGMYVMRLRVCGPSGKAPTILRSCVRLVGLVLAIIPLFAGFIPALFDSRRRALQDFLAGTAVVVVEPGEE